MFLAQVGGVCVHYAAPIGTPGSPTGYSPFMYPLVFYAISLTQFSKSSKVRDSSSLMVLLYRLLVLCSVCLC